MRCHTWVLLVSSGVIHGASCVMRCYTWCFLCYEVSYMGASCVMRCHTWCFLCYELWLYCLHTRGTAMHPLVKSSYKALHMHIYILVHVYISSLSCTHVCTYITYVGCTPDLNKWLGYNYKLKATLLPLCYGVWGMCRMSHF